MIIKANQRASGQELACHLLNAEDNEHVTLHELRGFAADDLHGAFKEAEAISRATKCQKYLFSVSLNPPPDADVSLEAFEDAASRIEIEFGLIGQPRAMVLHEKEGRLHAHCVWSRIEPDEMKAVHLSHYKRRMMGIAHDLYIEHGWNIPLGLQRFGEPDPDNYGLAEYQQAKRAKADPAERKRLFRETWEKSDSAAAFRAALEEHGFVLARGDKRVHVAVDEHGEVYSLSRACGVKTRELKARLGDPYTLPSVEEAQAKAEAIAAQKRQATIESASEGLRKRQLSALSKVRTDMIVRHKSERKALLTKQQERQKQETRGRASRFGRGLKAVWEFISGKRAKIRKQNEEEAERSRQRDRQELHVMRKMQLRQRRALVRQREMIKAQKLDHQQYRRDGPEPYLMSR